MIIYEWTYASDYAASEISTKELNGMKGYPYHKASNHFPDVHFVSAVDPLPDFPQSMWKGAIISRALYDAIIAVGEFAHDVHPVKIDVDRPYVALIVHALPGLFDKESAQWRPHPLYAHRVGAVKRFAFHKPLPPLFRVAEAPARMFVTEEMKEVIEQYTGSNFTDYWTDSGKLSWER